MKNKAFLITLLIGIIVALITTQAVLTLSTNLKKHPTTETIATTNVGTTIAGDGVVHSENETTLHFQTAGKVVYLPFKIGDSVAAGQTIAQLDTYTLQRQLTLALNTYQSTRDTFDQSQQNAQDNILQSQQNSTVAGVEGDKTNTINDIVKRLLDQNQLSLNSSVANVELANYAVQLASLTAPFSGVITAEDITTPNVNVTTATSFSLADPTALVFRANVAPSDIDFVHVGSGATIHIVGVSTPFTGTVERIYPQQTTVNGQNVYQVDVASTDMSTHAKLGQNGTVTITSTAAATTVLVPTWSIIGHKSVWVLEDNHPVLKMVTVGQSHGSQTEILGGLQANDRIIVSPESVAATTYNAL